MTPPDLARPRPARLWLGMVALVLAFLSLMYLALASVTVAYGIAGAPPGQQLLWLTLLVLLPLLIVTGVGVWAIVRSRPRWVGIVATALCAAPLALVLCLMAVMASSAISLALQPTTEYSSLDDLKAAYVKAGGTCTKYEDVSNELPQGGEAVKCFEDGFDSTLMFFETTEQRDAYLKTRGSGFGGSPVIGGEHWAASEPYDAAVQKLGGKELPRG
ncbi:putative membrane-bound mannosyltransferase [Microbacterium resistens]|uniref:Membrane-bound mannosyltransferase n=1 Tax=Microbacterium resistens TaxID=156977 RepID=A0ABU1S8A8_9MICO|nr:hypothetical protein [Microbacterium resistens]MDR6865847.1 putative membrane-bound mannosyltransferase [Microbacterium resistens]